MEKKWKSKFKKILTPLIIFLIIFFSLYVINSNKKQTSQEIAKCIGQRAELYVQLGCPHCILQEQEFGENYKYLNVVDCFYEREKCIEKQISATPTWIISQKRYEGFQSLETVRNITGC